MQAHLVLRPWEGARAQGRIGYSRLLLLMQVSLVFWPAAVRAAKRIELEEKKQLLLDMLAEAHAAPRPAQLALPDETQAGRVFGG